MSFRPKCPNHTCEMDPTDEPRIYICPISSAEFEVDVDGSQKKKKIDKFGAPMTEFIVTPLDGAEKF
jgi:hypothetical protein